VNKIRFVAQKEFYHIRRDPRSLVIVIFMPIMMAFLYGYAINLDIENITIAVTDYDQTAASRELIAAFFESNYFTPSSEAPPPRDPESLFRSNKASAILTIPPGFSEALATGDTYQLGMTVDGADAILAAAVQNYSNVVLMRYLASRYPEGLTLPGIIISAHVAYNPDLKSSHFLVPGLIAIILMMISALLTSITIARERETGTLEQLLTAPVRTREILIGKLLPYVIIAFVDGILVLAFAMLVFSVPFIGSHLLLILFGLIYVATALSLGILISTFARTQQVAMMFALTLTVLPSVMLSGFIFAIKNMPIPLQLVSYLVSARYFIKIIRGIMLKGSSLEILAPQGLALIALMVILLAIATYRFKTSMS